MSSTVFLLMPWGRVGSNMLLNIIKKNVDVRVFNEPTTAISSKFKAYGKEKISSEQEKWFDEKIFCVDNDSAVLVNIALSSLVSLRPLRCALNLENVYGFTLIRRNPVAVALSVLKAEAYAEAAQDKFGKPSWAVKQGMEIETCPIIDKKKFLHFVDAENCHRKTALHISEEYALRVIWYHDLTQWPIYFAREIVEALNVRPPRNWKQTDMVKAITKPYENEFENYCEVRGEVIEARPALKVFFDEIDYS